jgi:predicted AlkP superfamily phosphohydrolase/phosphomutase
MGNIGQIYVNLKGREPQGIVEPGQERDQLLDEISAALYQLTDEGQPVVDQILRSEEIYQGDYAARGPDLNILMRGLTYVSQSWREMAGGAIFGPSGYSGTHRPLGLVALHGQHIPAAGQQPEAQIVDVAPTLLWLLGLPIPNDLDGQLLAGLLRPESLAQQPPQHIDATGAPVPQSVPHGWADAEEEQKVLDRLRDLGYLD